MNDVLMKELQEAINQLNDEIIQKREILDSLIEEYQNLSETPIDEDVEII